MIAFVRCILDAIKRAIETTGENVKLAFYDEEHARTNAETVEQWIASTGEVNPDAIREDIRKEIARKVDI